MFELCLFANRLMSLSLSLLDLHGVPRGVALSAAEGVASGRELSWAHLHPHLHPHRLPGVPALCGGQPVWGQDDAWPRGLWQGKRGWIEISLETKICGYGSLFPPLKKNSCNSLTCSLQSVHQRRHIAAAASSLKTVHGTFPSVELPCK